MEREWKEGKERKRRERGEEWNLGGVCVIGFRGIDAPGNGESCRWSSCIHILSDV